jgi:hypothetical protein
MTTLDALWMGVPVVTCPGRTISSRLAAANLIAAGLDDGNGKFDVAFEIRGSKACLPGLGGCVRQRG